MSTAWSIYISIITLGVIGGCIWLMYWTHKDMPDEPPQNESMGHDFDGIEELNNPMPTWWVYMFVATIVFSLGYYLVYPALGKFGGLSGWTAANQWEQRGAEARERYAPLYTQYAQTPITELAKDEEALAMGRRLYLSNCAVCHGSAAKGGIGFPNLTDQDWLYGGSPENIKTTLLHGRRGAMPPMEAAIGGESGTVAVTEYVVSLSRPKTVDPKLLEKGKTLFNTACAACHGINAKGNQALGAPNLTDDIWLYGRSRNAIMHTIKNGRAAIMPAQKDSLGEDKVHVLTAYVYSLSQSE